MNYTDQNQILDKILELNREMEALQNEINALVLKNRALPENDDKDKDYTECIESYYAT